MSLNFNALGIASLKLPQGPQADSYRVYLRVNIIDDTNGVTLFTIPNPVTVSPNTNLTSSLENGPLLTELNSGNLNLVARNAIALSDGLNMQVDSSQSAEQTNQMAVIREFLVSKVSDLTVTDSRSINTISTSLSTLTRTAEQVSSQMAVNTFKVKKNIYFKQKITFLKF